MTAQAMLLAMRQNDVKLPHKWRDCLFSGCFLGLQLQRLGRIIWLTCMSTSGDTDSEDGPFDEESYGDDDEDMSYEDDEALDHEDEEEW